jgi:hypothetical protein
MGHEGYLQCFDGKSERNNLFEKLGLYGRIILKCICKK